MIICRPSSLGNCSTRISVAQLVADALQQRQAEFLVRDLAAAKAQRDLALVAFVQKAPDVAHLDVVVTVVGTRAGT